MLRLVVSGYYVRRFFGRFVWPNIGKLLIYSVGRNCIFMGRPILEEKNDSKIVVGDSVTLVSNCFDTALGVTQPTIIRTLRSGAKVLIGENSAASGLVICSENSVRIGKSCLLGANVKIFDTDFHVVHSLNRIRDDQQPAKTSPVNIGDNVFIGTGVIVCKGVSIGDNSVVGAGSVVTKSFSSNSIIAGSPAKIIGKVYVGK